MTIFVVVFSGLERDGYDAIRYERCDSNNTQGIHAFLCVSQHSLHFVLLKRDPGSAGKAEYENLELRVGKQVWQTHENQAGGTVLLKNGGIIYNWQRIYIPVNVFLKFPYVFAKMHCFINILPI